MFHLMKKISVFSVMLLLASCASSRTRNHAATAPTGAVGDTASRVFSEVNAYRMTCGKKSLVRHTGLDRLAKQHSEYLAKKHSKGKGHGSTVNHDGFQQRCSAARQSYHFTAMSEIVAGFPTANAAQIVSMWKNSRDHDRGMKGDWDLTGVGIAVAPDGMVFATQMFANAAPQ
jgi:uncharacterized protein YkwD